MAGEATDSGRMGSATDEATSVFVDHRELLFSVTYNILGSVADTEDVLQETWLSWSRRCCRPGEPAIDNPRAYLVRIAVNHALARSASIKRRREAYAGPWLPEPLVTESTSATASSPRDPDDHALHVESVSMAVLVVLQSLSPLERAVFVLHEVFGYTHPEIAAIIDRSPSAVRQLAHRAREHVHARRPRYRADPHVQKQVTERFLAAAFGGDIAALMQILAPEVTLWIDGGRTSRAALRPVADRERIVRLITGYASRRSADFEVQYRHVNGDPSAVVFAEGSPFAVMVLDLEPDGDRVREVYVVTNPEKLSRVTVAD